MSNLRELEIKKNMSTKNMPTAMEKRIIGVMDKRFGESEKRIIGVMDKRFEEVDQQIEDLSIATKNGFDQMVTKEHFDFVISGADRRLDIIENVSIGGHERRIEILEDKVGVLNSKLGIIRRK